MKIKICGMREPANIREIEAMDIDQLGFIFYKDSPRYVGDDFEFPTGMIPKQIQKTGVFVNSPMRYVQETIEKYHLDMIQLHGNESPEYCKLLHQNGFKVIKAFALDAQFDFNGLEDFMLVCDFFLFDTKSALYGGSGHSFDWQLLKSYHLPKPFYLSGGLGLDNVDDVLKFKHPMLYGYDFNSGLENHPGLKNKELTASVIHKIRNYENT